MSCPSQRFWNKVSKDGPIVPGLTQQCWLWTGAVDGQGYPRFKLNGSAMYGNRARLIIEGIMLDRNQHVVSLCRNKICVRPKHHVVGTGADTRSLGKGGYYDPGYQFLLRQYFERGEVEMCDLKSMLSISPQVIEAILAEGRLN